MMYLYAAVELTLLRTDHVPATGSHRSRVAQALIQITLHDFEQTWRELFLREVFLLSQNLVYPMLGVKEALGRGRWICWISYSS